MLKFYHRGQHPMAKRFSQLFGLKLQQPQLDFVDIMPSTDTPLFIDPFAISLRNDPWSAECHRHIVHFFTTALEYIKAGKVEDARSLLNGLSEPNETCLGLSRGTPSGRGVSGKQALDLYANLANSQAAKTGLLEELAECDLFVDGIGRDKVSDITTNIIRRLLIEYTQTQCELHGIQLEGTWPTGRFWDIDSRSWRSGFAKMPIFKGRRLILVPKYSVRRRMALHAQEYYSHHILNFIRDEEFQKGSLLRTLKNGQPRPAFKKDVKAKFPFSKDFVARFSEQHPKVLEGYKKLYGEIEGASGVLKNTDFDEDLDEALFAKALIEALRLIPPGRDHADEYHSFILGVLEFIFWPDLIYPKKEVPIHDGRKRIDITFTNAAKGGFFYRVHTAHQIASNWIMVECKNYAEDPANPEIDQLAGRFSINRGRLGLLLFRGASNYDLLFMRCHDVASNGNGFILPLGDVQICDLLDLIASGNRSAIDRRLEEFLARLVA
jgi:hypothetical protein